MNDVLDILLIEDDLDARANLSDILELDGHRVSVAESGQEAKKLAANAAFDTVVLDRKLPDGDAENLLPCLRRLLPMAEIIVVTAYADLHSTIAALRHQVCDYILKPINADALRSRLEQIVSHRRVESKLRSEQQFANEILRTAEAVILVLDSTGCIVRFNPYFERITGWKLTDVIGKNWFESFIPEEDLNVTRSVFDQTIHELKTVGVVNQILTREGQRREIRWSNSALADESGKTRAVLAIGVDITDLIEAQQQKLQAQRLAAIGQTMTALAHESRSALQRIQAGLELLELVLEDRPEAHRDLQTIKRATDDLHALLEEVRSYAAPIHLHLEAANLAELWRRAWQSLKNAWQDRDATLIETPDNPSVNVHVDAMRMEQVFRNLFENALAACKDPVRISITSNRAEKDDVEVIIADNGNGFNDEQHSKAFEPFFTTKSTGTGLGLSIVQRIVETHGGSIWIDGAMDHGAVFHIQLPHHPHRNSAQDAMAR